MKRGALRYFFLALSVILVASCRNPAGDVGKDRSDSLTVRLGDGLSRSILPGIGMSPASYEVSGSGPDAASFRVSIVGATVVTVPYLVSGEWTVTATAKNAEGTAIGVGSAALTKAPNAAASVSITVRPFDGFGALTLSVSWPAAQAQDPRISSTLLPSSGAARSLAFSVDQAAGTAAFSASDVATGYHTLTLKLLDGGKLCLGAVEVVRIAMDQTSAGNFAFAEINKATDSLDVDISAEPADPLIVSISGDAPTKEDYRSMALSAAVSGYAGNATYVWYVNGEAKETGELFSFDESWAQGWYRIDVTAYSADGSRAGSATTTVHVVPTSYYAIGDVGPSGVGRVFYATAGGLHGMEAAPSGWAGSSEDPFGMWGTANVDTPGTAPEIGAGYANTYACMTGAEHPAAELCRAYRGGGKSDWFLPSFYELYMMYQRQNSIGGGLGGVYCSSTQYFYNPTYGFYIDISNGQPIYTNKTASDVRVRPARAF